MELTFCHSSLRLPAISPSCCKASSHNSRLITIKPITKNIKPFGSLSRNCGDKVIRPVGIHGESRFSRFLIYGQHKRNSIQACAQNESDGSDPIRLKVQDEADSILARVSRFGFACFKFVRPFAMFPLLITASSLFARVLVENPQLFKWSLLFKAIPGLIAVLLCQAYNNCINQIYDVDIDRINKQYLPIASGDLSMKQAWFLVIFEALIGILILRLMNADRITTSTYYLSLLLATSYSVPPFRFKKFSVATSILIPLTSGIINTGVFYATRASLGLPFCWSPSLVFITTFTTLFFTVISNIKDITDMEGDMKYNIRTFSVIFGPKKIVSLSVGILLINYIGAITAAIYMPQAFKSYVVLPAHIILAIWLLFQAWKLDNANYAKEASANFYLFLWKLVTLEYLLFPFM
ncbi:homogentisate solanesyltransferase, chloroplastic [Morus notabilis]|uniref:homogentisate solanesyltransferase, chloroplastic n=1 Tax=Morus notabilis TaxID=981085 RepID=UPI000CED7896|nr:homogentisate solanesyltransferase, chloroplastic [Morus notabilis]